MFLMLVALYIMLEVLFMSIFYVDLSLWCATSYMWFSIRMNDCQINHYLFISVFSSKVWRRRITTYFFVYECVMFHSFRAPYMIHYHVDCKKVIILNMSSFGQVIYWNFFILHFQGILGGNSDSFLAQPLSATLHVS